MPEKHNLVWMDLEMTGLNPEHDHIIEIATIVTDSDLNIIEEGPVMAIHQDDALLDGMDEWNTKHHNASGLVERVKESTIDEAEAEKATLAFIKKHVDIHRSPLCGNSIHQDRRFIVKYMPKLEYYFHYRCLDVSTLKILAHLWAPQIVTGLTKEAEHRALQDIRDSIDELRYYREHFIK